MKKTLQLRATTSAEAVIRSAIIALCLTVASFAVDAGPRDQNQKNAFKRENPCPANGKKYGACPGWEVDHKVPLKCGGADHPSNMQWLTRGQHKLKTKREAKSCRKPR